MLGQIGAGLSKYNTFDMDVAQRAADWLQEPAQNRAMGCLHQFCRAAFPVDRATTVSGHVSGG